LTFRGYETEAILWSDPVSEVERKLKALVSLSDVIVSFSTSVTTACIETGNDITVEFTQQFGEYVDMIPSSFMLII
jgi:hypothetical protein